MRFLDSLLDQMRLEQQEVERLTQEEDMMRKKRDEELRSIAERQEKIKMRIRHIHALLALEGHSQPESNLLAPAPDATTPVLTSLSPSLADHAYQLLAEAGQPLHYKKLAHELMSRGVLIPGREPANNLVARICADPRLLRPQRGFYGLREWYAPGSPSVGTRNPKTETKRKEAPLRGKRKAAKA